MSRLCSPYRGALLNRSHPLARGLICCQLFNEGAGRHLFDLSRNNDMSYVVPDYTSTWQGGGGIKTDSTKYATIPTLDLTAYDAVTVVATTRAEALSGNQILWELSDNFNFNQQSFLAYCAGSYIYIDQNASGMDVWKTTPISVNQACQIAGVYQLDGGRITGYVNGTVSGSLTSANSTQSGTYGSYPLYVGARAGSSLFFDSFYKRFYIYNRALSPAEIGWLYREPDAMIDRITGRVYAFGGIVGTAVRATVRGERNREAVGMQL